MKKFLLSVVAMVALVLGSALYAQDVAGTWQGRLQPPNAPQPSRVVLQLSTAGGTVSGFFYPSIDQSGQRVPIGAVSVQGSSVRFTIPAGGASFEGRLEGNTIAGTFISGQNRLPLNFEKATPETTWVIPNVPAAPAPMAADANLVFDVVSIKPSKPDTPGFGITMRGPRQFATLNTSLLDLAAFAYSVQKKQLIGLPDWADTAKYDISAAPQAEGMPNDRQIRTMMQRMLEDRFKLAFHRDKRELAVYALLVTRTGHKMTKTEAGPNSLPGLGFRALGNLVVRNGTTADFAQLMQNLVLDRPVVDQSGLTDRFDFTLLWTPDQFQFNGAAARQAPPPDNAPPDLFTAVQEQLGLRFDSTRAQTDVMVVDKVEKPTED